MSVAHPQRIPLPGVSQSLLNYNPPESYPARPDERRDLLSGERRVPSVAGGTPVWYHNRCHYLVFVTTSYARGSNPAGTSLGHRVYDGSVCRFRSLCVIRAFHVVAPSRFFLGNSFLFPGNYIVPVIFLLASRFCLCRLPGCTVRRAYVRGAPGTMWGVPPPD